MVVLERWNQPVLGDGFFALDLQTNRLRCFDAQMHTVNCKNLSHCNHGSFVKMAMEDQGSQRMTILDQWDGPTLALSSISTRCICSHVECSWIFNQETALLHLLTWQQYATQSKPFHSFWRLIYGVRCQGDPKCDSVDWAPCSALLSESLPQLYSNFPFSMVTCPCSCLFLHCNKGWLHPPQFRANLPEEYFDKSGRLQTCFKLKVEKHGKHWNIYTQITQKTSSRPKKSSQVLH